MRRKQKIIKILIVYCVLRRLSEYYQAENQEKLKQKRLSTLNFSYLSIFKSNLQPPTSNLLLLQQYSYDDVGNLKEMTDPRGKETDYDYNTLNQLTLTTYPDNTTESQIYDKVGNVVSKHVYERDGTDGNILYSYDKIYRLLNIVYPELDLNNSIKKVEYSYDDNGNRLSMVEKDKSDAISGQINYSYNNRNWLTSDTRTIDNGQLKENVKAKTNTNGQWTMEN